MGIFRGLLMIKNGDYQRNFKSNSVTFYVVMNFVMAISHRNLYNRLKTVTLSEVKNMRPLLSMLAVVIMLGPIGMGILSFADAPVLTELDTPDDSQTEISERGTRGVPPEGFEIVNLYFYSTGSGDIMNTTEPWATGVATQESEITFSLEPTLQSMLEIKDDVGEYGMEAVVYLSGQDTTVHIEVFDNSESNLVGEATSDSVSASPTSPSRTQTRVNFETGTSYEFLSGSSILVRLTATGTLAPTIHYETQNRNSHIKLNCIPISDITVETYNFRGTKTNVFYPNDITEPDNRRLVEIEGTVIDAFSSSDVRYVEINITGPEEYGPWDAIWDRSSSSFNYTWEYDAGINDGEYNITANVVTRQYNEYTYYTLIDMSKYGVLLTSPHQKDGPGTYTPAELNVIQNSSVSYLIHVWNIGNSDVTVDLSATGNEDWIFKFENENITITDSKNGKMNLSVGFEGIKLTVNAQGKSLGEYVNIYVSAVCAEDTDKKSDLLTTTTVKVKFEVTMEFDDGQKSKTENAEIGTTLEFNFTVTNTGGTEDDIYFAISGVPSNWDSELIGVQTSPSLGEYVHLKPTRSKELTLRITTPSSGGDTTEDIEITGKSHGSEQQGDPDVASDTLTATIAMTSGVKLDLTNPSYREKYGSPGEQESFQFVLTNTGIKAHDFMITFTQPVPLSQGWAADDISFSSFTYTPTLDYSDLGADGTQIFSLYIEPTTEVIADNYTITVKAQRADDSSRLDEEKVYFWINEDYEIEVLDPIDLELSGEAEPGEDVVYEIQIKNNGNIQERINVFVEDMPGGWDADFGNANSSWTKDIEPQETETITLTLSVPDDAVGDETVDITVAIVPSESDRIDIETHTKIKGLWYQPLMMLLVPILLFVVIIVMVIVIYRRR